MFAYATRAFARQTRWLRHRRSELRGGSSALAATTAAFTLGSTPILLVRGWDGKEEKEDTSAMKRVNATPPLTVEILRDSLDIAVAGQRASPSSICKMDLWQMLAQFPRMERAMANDISRGVTDGISYDYQIAIATRSETNFYVLAKVLLKNAPEHAKERVFCDLFYLVRDIHDEHHYKYGSPYVEWSSNHEKTRNALVWLWSEHDSFMMSASDRMHLDREFSRL